MASVSSQLIEEVTAHAQSDSLEDAREICADGIYFQKNQNTHTHTHIYIYMSRRRMEGVAVQFHSFWTSMPVAGKWPANCPSRFDPAERALGTNSVTEAPEAIWNTTGIRTSDLLTRSEVVILTAISQLTFLCHNNEFLGQPRNWSRNIL